MAEFYPSARHRWLLATGVGLMAVGATGNAVTAPTWGGLLQAAGLVGAVAVVVRWARSGRPPGGRWRASGPVLLWAVGTVLTAVAVPRLGAILTAGGAIGAGIVAVGWARSTPRAATAPGAPAADRGGAPDQTAQARSPT